MVLLEVFKRCFQPNSVNTCRFICVGASSKMARRDAILYTASEGRRWVTAGSFQVWERVPQALKGE